MNNSVPEACGRATLARALACIALLLSIVAIVLVFVICPKPCPCPTGQGPRKVTEEGPASTVVRLKNESGQQVLKDWRVRVSSTADGTGSGPVLGPGPFNPIPHGNSPGAFKSGPPPSPDPSYRDPGYSSPPYVYSYVFNFELGDGTKFVDVVCAGKPTESNMLVYEVHAHLRSRTDSQSGDTLYWIEFTEGHAVETSPNLWVWRPVVVSQTAEVPAGGTLTGVW